MAAFGGANRTPGQYALFEAIKNKRYRQALLLVEAGVDVNSRNARGETPLICTSICVEDCKKRTKLSKLFLHAGADPNLQDWQGFTALIHGCINGQSDVVLLLIDNTKTDPTIKDIEGNTALMHAAAYGHADVISTFINSFKYLKKALELTAKNNNGYTALQLAMENGHELCVKLLKREIELYPNVHCPSENKIMEEVNVRDLSKDKTAEEINTDGLSKDKTAKEINTDGLSKDKTAEDINTDGLSEDKTVGDISIHGLSEHTIVEELSVQSLSEDKESENIRVHGQHENKTMECRTETILNQSDEIRSLHLDEQTNKLPKENNTTVHDIDYFLAETTDVKKSFGSDDSKRAKSVSSIKSNTGIPQPQSMTPTYPVRKEPKKLENLIIKNSLQITEFETLPLETPVVGTSGHDSDKVVESCENLLKEAVKSKNSIETESFKIVENMPHSETRISMETDEISNPKEEGLEDLQMSKYRPVTSKGSMLPYLPLRITDLDASFSSTMSEPCDWDFGVRSRSRAKPHGLTGNRSSSESRGLITGNKDRFSYKPSIDILSDASFKGFQPLSIKDDAYLPPEAFQFSRGNFKEGIHFPPLKGGLRSYRRAFGTPLTTE